MDNKNALIYGIIVLVLFSSGKMLFDRSDSDDIETDDMIDLDTSFQFRDIQWQTTILDRNTYQNIFTNHRDDVNWKKNSDGIIAQEKNSIYLSLVGFITEFSAERTYINISTITKNTAKHENPQDSGILAYLFHNSNGQLTEARATTISNTDFFVQSLIYFDDLIVGDEYSLFICFSDAWETNWKQTIWIKNIQIGVFDEDPLEHSE
ncbi:MAG: hypothetical protein OEY49_08940, partial [Candidatus Heimdallarchaeota archaeon]|nr:hypothetical protein [Candidatus Heimdallarchaeota archaeon]